MLTSPHPSTAIVHMVLGTKSTLHSSRLISDTPRLPWDTRWAFHLWISRSARCALVALWHCSARMSTLTKSASWAAGGPMKCCGTCMCRPCPLSHLSQASWCVMVTSPSFLTIEWGKGEQHSTANCPMLPGTGTNCKTLVIPHTRLQYHN
jgi:hypothetical protein